MTPRPPGSFSDPRELLLTGHADSLPDDTLLSMVLGEGRRETVERLLADHPIPDGLWRVSRRRSRRTSGCGSRQRGPGARVSRDEPACRCMALVARADRSRRPRTSCDLCAAQLRGLRPRALLGARAQHQEPAAAGRRGLGRVSLNASIVHPRELFKEAVRVSAASIVVVHNHPSGDPTPSGADIQLTRRLVQGGRRARHRACSTTSSSATAASTRACATWA